MKLYMYIIYYLKKIYKWWLWCVYNNEYFYIIYKIFHILVERNIYKNSKYVWILLLILINFTLFKLKCILNQIRVEEETETKYLYIYIVCISAILLFKYLNLIFIIRWYFFFLKKLTILDILFFEFLTFSYFIF